MRRVTTSRIIWARILIGLQIFSLNTASPWLIAAESSGRLPGIRPFSNGRSSAPTPSIPRPAVPPIGVPAAPAPVCHAVGGRGPPTGEPTRSATASIVQENSLPGTPPSLWDVVGRATPSIQGFATDISVNRGQTVQFKIKTPATGYRLDIYRMGYYGGMGARKVATIQPTASLPQTQPACLTDGPPASSTAATGRSPPPGRCRRGVGHLLRQTRCGTTDTGRREPHLLRRARRRRPLGPAVPDVRHDLAGLQQLRRQQPVFRQCSRRPRVQGQLQPAVQHARHAESFVFNAEYPMVRWLEANGYDVSYFTGVDSDRRRRPRSRAQGLPVGRPRRVLVGRAADQRRGGAQRRRQPGVLQRQRNVLEDALGKQHRRHEHAVPHAGQLQGDARERQDRSEPAVDGHVARSAIQPAGRRRAPRKRADRHAVPGQRL